MSPTEGTGTVLGGAGGGARGIANCAVTYVACSEVAQPSQ